MSWNQVLITICLASDRRRYPLTKPTFLTQAESARYAGQAMMDRLKIHLGGLPNFFWMPLRSIRFAR